MDKCTGSRRFVFKKRYCTESIGCKSKHMFVQVAPLGLKPYLDDSFRSVDMATWRHFTVGVLKRRPVVETL